MTGLGLRRLQHLVLYVADVERSVRFYVDVLGFEIQRRYPKAAFLKIPLLEAPTAHSAGCWLTIKDSLAGLLVGASRRE